MTEESDARNSHLRRFSPAGPIAKFLTRRFHWLTADQVTFTGLGAVLGGSLLKAIPERMTLGERTSSVALGLMVFSALCDGLDGAIVREKGTSSNYGAIVDVLTDRIGESGMASARIFSASQRRDPLGVLAATLCGITGPLASLLRAEVEKLGYYVPESGYNPITFLGTRPMRVLFGTATTTYPEIPLFGSPMQPTIDAISAFSNILTTIERVKILRRAKRGEIMHNPDDSVKELGKIKSDILLKFSVVNSLALIASGFYGILQTLE